MSSDRDITHDSIYDTVHRDDFDRLLEVDRYADRSDAFDSIISATVDHFWDPQDPRYVDFSLDFDMAEQTVMPREFSPELHSAVSEFLGRLAQFV